MFVSWNDAQEFCKNVGLRLPYEEEWEYAYRAGTKTKYYWGDSMDGKYCWYEKNAWDIGQEYAHQVKKKIAECFWFV